jgi:hypothetical protein
LNGDKVEFDVVTKATAKVDEDGFIQVQGWYWES